MDQQLNYDAARFWLDALQWLALAAVGAIAWFRTQTREIETKVAAMDQRLNTLEVHVRHFPTADELAELQGDMKAVKATIEGIDRRMEIVQRQISRVEDFLLKSR